MAIGMCTDDAVPEVGESPPTQRRRAAQFLTIGIWVGGGLLVGAAIALQPYLWGPALQRWDWCSSAA